jgi:hypothetical protein
MASFQHLHALGAGGFRLRAVRRNVVWDDDDFAQGQSDSPESQPV